MYPTKFLPQQKTPVIRAILAKKPLQTDTKTGKCFIFMSE
jgi:hypothetical protein